MSVSRVPFMPSSQTFTNYYKKGQANNKPLHTNASGKPIKRKRTKKNTHNLPSKLSRKVNHTKGRKKRKRKHNRKVGGKPKKAARKVGGKPKKTARSRSKSKRRAGRPKKKANNQKSKKGRDPFLI